MRLCVISDTHGFHRDIKNIPDGDVLIHCGDISNVGEQRTVEDFVEWLKELPHHHKIFIAGNHDKSFQLIKTLPGTGYKPSWLDYLLGDLLANDYGIHYLEDDVVEIEGITFYGSPYTPDFYPEMWVFNKPRGKEIRDVWKKINVHTDVLITHGPPFGILDKTTTGQNVGCADLATMVDLVRPRCHFFGHIHERGGSITSLRNVLYGNASLLNEKYRLTKSPIIYDYE